MSEDPRKTGGTAEELRRAFDESFAAAPAPPAGAMRDLLAVRVEAGHYALDVADLAGLEAGRKIVGLPVGDPAVLGLAGVRGRLLAVYHLGTLLGEAGSPAPPWLAICGEDEPVALAFDDLEGQIRISPADLFVSQGGVGSEYRNKALVWRGTTRHVLDVRAILETIRARAGIAAGPREE